jgi:hypothetical protein
MLNAGGINHLWLTEVIDQKIPAVVDNSALGFEI